MSSQASMEAGVRMPSPPQTAGSTSTPTLVRSRPKLPNIFGASQEDGGMGDLVGVISTLGSTDFVGKYSTSRRKRSGVNSPQHAASQPLSPMSPVLSPSRMKSPPPEGSNRAPITLTRMKSIKLKLEKVKQNQDRAQAAAEMLKNASNSGNSPRRKTATVDPPRFGYLARDGMQPSMSTPSLEKLDPSKKGKNFSFSTPSVIDLQSSDSQETINDPSTTGSETEGTQTPHNMCQPGPLPSTDSRPPAHPSDSLNSQQHNMYSDSTKTGLTMKNTSSTERDSDSPLHVTSTDEDSRARNLVKIQTGPVHKHKLKRVHIDQKLNQDSSFELEDEGLGAVDIEDDRDPNDMNILHGLSSKPGVLGEADAKGVQKLLVKAARILPPKLPPELVNSGGKDAKRGNGNGRFLTHPPSKEKPIPKEGGSVDSNGLGSLRCSKDPVNTNDLTSQVNVELSKVTCMCARILSILLGAFGYMHVQLIKK